MKKIICALVFVFMSLSSIQCYGYEKEIKDEKSSEEIFVANKIDRMPEYPGGIPGLTKYLSENIKYPKTALEDSISGRVIISFIVEKNGSVSNIEVAKSVHPTLDEEAVRVVKNMPKWSPGIQSKKPVRVRFQLPVNFKLN